MTTQHRDGVADVLQIKKKKKKIQLLQFCCGSERRESVIYHVGVASTDVNKEVECVLPSLISAHYLCLSEDLWV